MWICPRFCPRLVIGCLVIGLGGCATDRTIARFQTGNQTISLEQSSKLAGYSVRIGASDPLPLAGYTTAHIGSIWDLSRTRVAVITGATRGCTLRYTLLVLAGDKASLHPIGVCGETYSLTQEGQSLVIREDAPRARKVWTFHDGVLEGPLVLQIRKEKPPQARAAEEPTGTASDVLSPPPVSPPVGDEVIPSPVGGSGSAVSKRNDPSLF